MKYYIKSIQFNFIHYMRLSEIKLLMLLSAMSGMVSNIDLSAYIWIYTVYILNWLFCFIMVGFAFGFFGGFQNNNTKNNACFPYLDNLDI